MTPPVVNILVTADGAVRSVLAELTGQHVVLPTFTVSGLNERTYTIRDVYQGGVVTVRVYHEVAP